MLHTGPANKVCGLTKDGNIFVYNGKTLESFFAAHSFSFGDPSAVEPDPLRPDEYWIGTTNNLLVKEKILSELQKARGTQLDASIFDVLLELIGKGEIEIEKDAK